jgi:hypothetical protein
MKESAGEAGTVDPEKFCCFLLWLSEKSKLVGFAQNRLVSKFLGNQKISPSNLFQRMAFQQ